MLTVLFSPYTVRCESKPWHGVDTTFVGHGEGLAISAALEDGAVERFVDGHAGD